MPVLIDAVGEPVAKTADDDTPTLHRAGCAEIDRDPAVVGGDWEGSVYEVSAWACLFPLRPSVQAGLLGPQ